MSLSEFTSTRTGETKSIIGWSRATGIHPQTLSSRLAKGISIDEAIDASSKINSINQNTITDPFTGETHTIGEWSKITKKSSGTIYNAVFTYGLPIDKVLHENNVTFMDCKANPDDSSSRSEDLTGRKFGDLDVIRRADHDYVGISNGNLKVRRKWLCHCNRCGNNKEILHSKLMSGKSTNCGCSNPHNFKDLTGQKFGHLTVIGRAPDKVYKNKTTVSWYCRCDCEQHPTIIVAGNHLTSGHTTSCGCRSGSRTSIHAPTISPNVPVIQQQYPTYSNIGYNNCIQYPQMFIPQQQPVYTQAIMYADSYGNLHSQEEYEANQNNFDN